MNACVYILTNHTNTVLYIGVTSNLERRIYEHKSGLLPGFSKRYKLCKLVYCESCSSILDAIRREKQLKSWRRSWKEELINRVNPQWKDLSTK
ncbi:MAG: GIY-YIG nuclease family protein [Elusimicrobiaceae bacterium]|nr:GIY-YIG nuclease family protein [Elusimicrobiaceae bacterium]